MAAQHFDFDGEFICEKGATFSHTFKFYSNLTIAQSQAIESGKVTEEMQTAIDAKEIDLTGRSVEMQVKTLASELVLTLSTANGQVSISGHELTLALTFEETEELLSGNYYYDLELTTENGLTVTREFEGRFVVAPEVTV